MPVFQRVLRSVLVSATAGVCGLAVPALASASTAVVSTNAPGAPFNSCAHPGYSSVQEAVAASVTTVKVCPGTYTEQVQITKGVKILAETGAVLKLPASPANSTTTCDTAIQPPYQPNQDEISICTPQTVTITGLQVEALWPAGTCYDSMYGIFVAGGATLKATNDKVVGAGASPINGCQGGVAYEIGTARTEPGEVGHASFKGGSVSGYQKNGITVEGAGSSIAVKGTTVTGAGATPEIAQNGIQVSYGAGGSIKSATVTGNECDNATCGADSQANYQSTGVLFYGAANGSSVTKSTIDGNDIGVYSESSSETEPTEPTSSQVLVSGNTLENDRYESVLVSTGWTTVDKNTIHGGNVGIQLLQYAGQPYGPKGTGTKDTISGMSKWAVQGYSDNQPSDAFGQFTVSNSKVSGNPAPTVAGSVTSNNPPKLKIFTENDT
jgi:hypothetical protein